MKDLLDAPQETSGTVGKLFFTMVAHMIAGQNIEVMVTARDYLRIIMMSRHLNAGAYSRFAENSDLPVTQHSRCTLFVKDYHIKAEPQLGFRMPRKAQPTWTGNPRPIGDDALTPMPPSMRLADITTALTELARVDRRKQANRLSEMPDHDDVMQDQETEPRKFDPKQAYTAVARAHAATLLSPDDQKMLSKDTRAVIADVTGVRDDALPLAYVHDELTLALKAEKATMPVARAITKTTFIGGYMVVPKSAQETAISCLPADLMCHCDLLQNLDEKHDGKPQLTILGVGDHHSIRSTRLDYVRGDLVHTEPVLGGTKKTTDFRTFNRTESFSETSQSTAREDETESKTEDRFKLESEMSAAVESEKSQEFGASIAAGFGPVKISANYRQTSHTASADKTRTARMQAQDRMNRALSKIRTQSDTRSSLRTIKETERHSGFALDNGGKPSFTGYYHAIDKHYSHQLHCVGKRLMVRVCLQQPMAFLMHCMSSTKSGGTSLEMPVAPDQWTNAESEKLTRFQQITPQNYDTWAAAFGVTDITPPPPVQTVSEQIDGTIGGESSWSSWGGKIALPERYGASSALANIQMSSGSGHYVAISVSQHINKSVASSGVLSFPLANETGEIAYGVRGNTGTDYTVNLVVTCQPTQDMMDRWKLSVFNAIWAEYTRKKSSYDNAVQAAAIEAGIKIQGRNPRANENLIREELMKLVIGATAPRVYYRGLNAMKFGAVCGAGASGMMVPEPGFAQARDDADLVTFLCQLYEWENMTYAFKPYFFANRADWCTLRKISDVDPKFEAAMSAGQVLIDLPVPTAMVPAVIRGKP